MKNKNILLCIVVLLLNGCIGSASGPKFLEVNFDPLIKNKSRIYIYRENRFCGGGGSASVYYSKNPQNLSIWLRHTWDYDLPEGNKIVQLLNNGYTKLDLYSGQHEIILFPDSIDPFLGKLV